MASSSVTHQRESTLRLQRSNVGRCLLLGRPHDIEAKSALQAVAAGAAENLIRLPGMPMSLPEQVEQIVVLLVEAQDTLSSADVAAGVRQLCQMAGCSAEEDFLSQSIAQLR